MVCTHPGSLTPRGEDILPQGVLSAPRGHTSVSHSGDLLSRVPHLGSVPPRLTSHCPTVSWALGHRTPSRLLLPEPRLRPSVSDINPLAVPSPFSEGDVTFDEVPQVGSRSWTRRSVLSPLPGASAWKSSSVLFLLILRSIEKWGVAVGPGAPESDCLKHVSPSTRRTTRCLTSHDDRTSQFIGRMGVKQIMEIKSNEGPERWTTGNL